MSTILNTIRDSYAAHHSEHQRRQTLERDLATYTSAADRLELDMMISRYSDEETRELREILDRQAVHHAA